MVIKSTIALIDRGSEAAYFLPPKVISLVLQNGSWILGAQRRVVLSDGCEELGFAFTKPSIYCIGCCREGRAGRGAEAASRPTAFVGIHEIFRKPETGQSSPRLILWHRLHRIGRLIRADRPGQPEPPGSTRCSMPSTSPIPN